MFTNIAALRNSSAMQSRVDTVERYLKKRAKAYTPDMIFPIAIIAESNSRDDFEWVERSSGTHIKVGYVNGVHLDLRAIAVADYTSLSAAKRTEAVVAAVNEKLMKPATPWTWQDGIWITAEGALTPAPTTDAKPADAAAPAPTSLNGASAKPKKEKKSPTPKAVKVAKAAKTVTPKAAKPGKQKKEPKAKPVKLDWLTANAPAKGAKVSTNEAAKQRKLVAASLEALIKSGRVEGGVVKGKKTTAITIIL